MPRVGVVIVNWNRASDTISAYKSLILSKYEDWHLYVVDNFSTDNSSEILSRELTVNTTLILNSSNDGFAGGCNRGIQRALLDCSSHIFLLNNDAIVLPSTISILINESIELDNNSILGCVVKFYETRQIQFFGCRNREDVGHPAWFDQDDLAKLSQKLIITDSVLGAALFAPADIWRRIGYLDERFYLNYEETDWCYRARKNGFCCYVVSNAIIFHKSGATMGPTNGPLQNYFMYRNELLFASIHATPIQKLNIFLRTLLILLKSIMKNLIEFRKIKESTKSHAIAIFDFLFGKFGDCPNIIRQFAMNYSSAPTYPLISTRRSAKL